MTLTITMKTIKLSSGQTVCSSRTEDFSLVLLVFESNDYQPKCMRLKNDNTNFNFQYRLL